MVVAGVPALEGVYPPGGGSSPPAISPDLEF